MNKPIYTYKTYAVTEQGDIIKFIADKQKLVKPFVHKDGTKQVSLSEDGKVKKFTIHKIVADTFIPNPNKYRFVLHKDGDLSNNDISNLEWCKTMQNKKRA